MKYFSKVRQKPFIALLALIGLAAAVFLFIQLRSGDMSEGAETEVVSNRGQVEETESGAKRYTSEHFGFTFQIPSQFSVGEFDEGNGRVILVQSSESESAFQIYISPYDEPASSLTPERIREDLPNLAIQSPEALPMTGGANALSFIGQDETFGQTREVWMVHDGQLYQVVTSASEQDFLAEVLNTWEFI